MAKIKLTFNRYTRTIDVPLKDNNKPIDKSFYNNYAYDSTHFNDLIKQFKFEEAADYAEQFVMNDTKEQTLRESDIENLRRQGRIFNGIYERTPDDDKQALSFYMNVFGENGINPLIGDNDIANAYSNLKDQLGGKGATKLKISFAPKKQYLFGESLDIFAKDNENDIQDFYDRSGLTEDDLRSAGVNVTKEEGNDVLIFEKTSKYSDYILYNLGNIGRPTISNYSGTVHKPKYINIQGLNDKNEIIEDPIERNYELVYNAQRLINDSKNIADKYMQPIRENRVYTSTISSFLEDGMEELRKQKAQGLITGTEYKRAMEERYSDITGVLKSLGSSNYHIYSNAYNENEDETMIELGNKARHWAIEEISTAEDFSLNSMISAGQIGTLVTIYGVPEDKKNIDKDDTPEDRVKGVKHQFFIPGLFHEKAQQAINADNRTRAEQELNDIQSYTYSYKTKEGKELSHVGGNIFEYNGKQIGVDEARTVLSKSMAIDDASKTIRQGFTDANGNVNKPLAEEFAKKVAFNVVNELFPNTPFTLLDLTPFGEDDLFNMRAIGGNVEASYKQLVNQYVYDKMLEAYSIYDLIMKDVNKYR